MKEMTRKEFLKLTGASTALLAMSHIIPNDNDSYILEKAYYCFEHNLPSYKENA